MAVSAPVSCSALEGHATGPVVAARGMEEISRCSPRGRLPAAALGDVLAPEKEGSQEDHDDDGCEEVGGRAAGTDVCCAGWGIWD